MSQHRYILDKSSKKFLCPGCGKKRFVRYIDIETNKFIPERYGRCDREVSCACHCNPYTDDYAKMILQELKVPSIDWKPKQIQSHSKQIIKQVFIPADVIQQTLHGYEQNIFIQNLLSNIRYPFDKKDIEKVISLYYLGTICNGYRAGAITIPFIDDKGNIRAVQVKEFNSSNHTTGTDFLHSIIDKKYKREGKPIPKWLNAYQQNQTKVSCLFGAHLINKYQYNPIALVEAPKTAILGTLYFGFPDNPTSLLWLAVYNLSSLNYEKCKELHGRDVYLFPDLSKNGNAFNLWSKKARDLSALIPNSHFEVSELIEQNAVDSERDTGSDLADYLIKMDWRKFRFDQKENTINNQCELPITQIKAVPIIVIENKKPEQTKQTSINVVVTPQIPYGTPSPVAIIDRKIENPPNFKDKELVIKTRIFKTISGDEIELVGLLDYGKCNNIKKHKKAKGYCSDCLLNCKHMIRINDKLRSKEYTQLEVLIMLNSKKKEILELEDVTKTQKTKYQMKIPELALTHRLQD